MLKSFRVDTAGAMSILFAGCICVLIAFIGFAVDYGMAQSERQELQGALDAAVLAAAKSPTVDKAEVVRQFLASSISRERFDALDIAVDTATPGEIGGVISYVHPTLFLAVLNRSNIPVQVRSTAVAPAPGTLSMTFEAKFAQGWYAKDIFLFVRDADGEIVEMQKVLSYDYDFDHDVKTFKPPVDTISASHDVTSGGTIGVMMRVWPDTIDIGSRSGEYVDYYSDDEDARIRRQGECEHGEEHKWEDGGNEDHRDFIYEMTCTSTEGGTTAIRLKN